MTLRTLIASLLLVGVASAASAQTPAPPIQNPGKLTFPASADQITIGPDGVVILASYAIEVLRQDAPGVVVKTIAIGKPTPDATGTITNLASGFGSGLTPNVVYVAQVKAIGAGGMAVSPVSNPFYFAGGPRAPGVPVVSK